MMRKVAVFDGFAYACPFFTQEYRVNNWYGCTHPKQEATDPDENGVERGKCYCCSCPLGYEPDEEDWNNPDVDWDGTEWDDLIGEDGEILMDGTYIAINIGPDAMEEEKEAWRCYERRIHRYDPDWQGWKEAE